jgi:protein subunit release factor B
MNQLEPMVEAPRQERSSGAHRRGVVRESNAMSKFGVSPEKEQALETRLHHLQIFDADLEETFVRSSGPGGQHVNKTSTCVRLVHKPTGITVKVQNSRSQGLNRFLARRLLADHIEGQREGKASVQAQQRQKIRRQKQRRARRGKKKLQERADDASADLL